MNNCGAGDKVPAVCIPPQKKEQFYRKTGKYNFEQQQRHNAEDELRQSPGMEERKKENLSKTDSHLFGNYKSDVIFCK